MALSDDQRFAMYTATEIGNAIKKRRRQLKITQKEFAERLGKSERTIQKYESGEITMKIDLIKLVADELNIPWQELLEAKSDENDILSEEDNSPSSKGIKGFKIDFISLLKIFLVKFNFVLTKKSFIKVYSNLSESAI